MSPGVASPGFDTAAVFISVEFGAAFPLIFAGTVMGGKDTPERILSNRVQLNPRMLFEQDHPAPVGVPVMEIESGKLESVTVVTPDTTPGPVFATTNV